MEASDYEPKILNEGLRLAMEWGENWLELIQERLSNSYPEMTQIQLDECNAICQAAMKFGHDQVYELAESEDINPTQKDIEHFVSLKYPWIDRTNLSHLYSQGMYYAWKDGLVK